MFLTSMSQTVTIILLATCAFLNQSASGQNLNIKRDSSETQIWIQQEIKFSYPKQAIGKNVQGKVVVSYDIDSTCSVVNVRLIKGIGYGCDEEAIKSVKRMKLTYPKEQRGKCIARYNIHQTFNFENSSE